MRAITGVVAALAALGTATRRLEAQFAGADRRPPVSFDVGIQIGQAVGEFASYVDVSGGLDFGLLVRPPGTPLGLRARGQFLIYGSSTRRYPFLPGVDVDVTTTHAIAGLTLGPQVTAGSGPVQFYLFGGIGFSYFGTSSSAAGSGSGSPFASSNNYDDVTFASEGGGGFAVMLSRRRHVQLDLSARFLNNGRVSYVTEEGLSICNGGTQLCVSPVESEANLVIYRIGLVVGLRRGLWRGDGDN